ncbi:outer membrane beta-barrel protein [Longitalea arenae]|uniref:outer membrane beta-barrel protein n=1 Tax=Longitalea arenae TaxID=2812558 RepID=UPI001968155E|nr:outer membrane beta-barrel protein [Longitalea arenae]
MYESKASRSIILFILITLLTTALPVAVLAQQRPADTALHKKAQAAVDTLVFPRTDSLRQVTVTASRNNLQVENGRVTMNVSNSTLATGSSVFDLLKTMPGISISQDENISLRGTEGVNVLIDGKMNYLTGKQLSDFLKGLSSDNVAKIELVTAPTAEFDAAGNAGFINIVTRRRTIRGFGIDLRSTLTRGSTWMYNENLSASINTRSLSIYGSFDYNTPNRKVKASSGNTVVEDDTSYRLQRSSISNYHINFYTWRLGADWHLAERHQLSAHYHGYFDDFTAPKEALVNRYTGADRLHSAVSTTNNIVEPYHYNAANLAWTWQIDSSAKKLTTETHYISYRNLSDALMTSITTDGATGAQTAVNALRSHQPGYITIRSAKTDLEWPHQSMVWKAGLKYAWVSNDNNYRFDSLVDNVYKEAASMSNHFLYDERISAAYLSASRTFKRTTVQAGLRIEHTDAKGYTVKGGFSNRWNYTRIFPSLSLDHQMKEHKVNLSVSRRINRPTYSDLNPVRWYTDQYFYYSGNPGLVPEMAWLLSAAFTFQQKYILTATYGLRDNYMTKRLSIDEAANAVKSQTANFRNMQRFDVLLSAPFHAGPWSMQFSGGLNYASYPIAQTTEDLTASRWAANAQVQQQLKLPGGLRFELATFIYSRELLGVYLKDELFYMDAGLRKSFLKDNLVVQCTFTDFLRTYRLRAASLSNATDYWYNDRPEAHRISLSVRYHIGGKLSSRKASSIEEQERL